MGDFLLKILKPSDVDFSKSSMVDIAGKVFFYKDRVFRAIYSEQFARIYSELLSGDWINQAFQAGLVKTWISNDFSMESAYLTLEHEYIPFETHPAECTSYMHWLSAKTMMQVNLELVKHGFLLKDAHPWNLMFKTGHPKFIDFGSVIKTEQLPRGWIDEFRKYFGVPIWLSSHNWSDFSLEYRRQHATGFGLKLFEKDLFKKIIFRPLSKLNKYSSDSEKVFSRINAWLEKHKPADVKQEKWAVYPQFELSNDPLTPVTPKQKFVFEILSENKPKKVLDSASNKGYYSEMAARLGSHVIAFDYEEYCVNECLGLAQAKRLNITPVIMDFRLPTPPYGFGLFYGSAYDRFKSDVVLALGLAHHMCITQRLPVNVFCEICMAYADEGIIFEYVDPTDKHVSKWQLPIPINYSLKGFKTFISKKFPNAVYSDKITDDGTCRTMAYFYK
jgi:hypothetical protein